jgi:YD repeat-containing protein
MKAMAVFQTSRRGYNFIVFAGALIAALTLTDKVLCKRSFTCDSNRDGDVTEFDALGFSEDFGLTTCAKGPPCAGDLDRDDDIDTADLGLFDNVFARLKDADIYTRAKPISSTLTAKPCEGDFDADGDLDGSDLVVFSADFGRTDCTSPPPCEGDFDADGDVDGSDLVGLSADFGRTDCPLTPPEDIDYGFLHVELEGGGGLVGGTIRMVNGNAIEYREDLTFPSPHRLRLAFRATYNSQSDRVGALGHGWTHTYEISFNPSFQLGNQTFLKIVDEMGRASYFQEDLTGEYLGAFGEHSQVKAENGDYVWYRLDGTKYRISPAGRLNSIDDQIGNRLQLNYNTQTQLLETVTDQTTGCTLRFYYDNGFLDYIKGPETEKVADGIWVAFDYDTNQNLTSVTYADGSSSPTDCTDCSGFTYDYAAPSNHNLTQKQDKHADRHLLNSWGYDENDRAVDNFKNSTIFFSIKGVSIEYVSDTQVKVTDAYGTLRTYTLEEVNGRKRVTAMTGPASAPYTDSNAKRWVFDGQMNLTEVEYAGGTINQYQDHNARGRAQTIKLAVGTPEARIITYTYHPQMRAILTRAETSLLQEGANKLTTWDFDDDYDSQPNESPTGLLSRIIEQGYTQDGSGDVVPYEYVTELNYNSKGQVTSVNAPRQPFGVNDDITSYDYDDQATHKWNLVGISRPYIGTTQFPISEYDDAGMPGKMIDVNNQSTIFSYDGRGRITSITHNADSSIGSLFYNAGKLDTTTDEDGVTRSFAYDSTYDRLERIYDHDGNYIQYDYDGKGNWVTIGKYDNQDSRTYRKHFNYEDQPDIPGKLWRVINPDGSCEKDICADSSYTEYQYDNAGNVFSIRDPEGHTTEYEYDAFNRIKKVKQTLPPPQVGTEPIDVITRYAYDKHGNLWKITDAEGNTTFYTHDDMGRVVETISPDAGTTSYLYDEAGNLKLKRDEKGITVKYYYDFLNRLLQVDFPAYDQHSAYSITYTYDEGKDGMGHRTGMKDASGSTVFEYDNRGRLVGTIVNVNEVH